MTIDVRKELEKMDVATARGRMELRGKAISLAPTDYEIARSADKRAQLYEETITALKEGVGAHRDGITAEEIEKVEFIREQLYQLASEARQFSLKHNV